MGPACGWRLWAERRSTRRTCRVAASALSARSSKLDDSFDCPACGAEWQAPLAQLAEPEECAFTERANDGERKGAA